MRSDGLLVEAGHHGQHSIRLTDRDPQNLRRLAGFICMLSVIHEISGRDQLTLSIEGEAKRLSRYTKCDMTPRVASFYNEVLSFWKDPNKMRREKAEQTARAALEKCFNAGMTLPDIIVLWDEVQVKKVHDA